MSKATQTLETVAVRFAGDSGDGMQLTGNQFTGTTAMLGNDLSTFPDYPSEIRAPAGSLAGVSGFQINFSSRRVSTPGDAVDALVAMNPAALRTSIADLRTDGIVIADTASFARKNLARAGYETDPLDDGTLGDYRVFPVDITGLTLTAVSETGLSKRNAVRCKNFFALGLVYWLFDRPLDHTLSWIQTKFAGKAPEVAEANTVALKAGYHYGETAEAFTHNYAISEAPIEPGKYRQISGNEAAALGLMAAAELGDLELFLGTYPITPATDILHHLAGHKHLRVRTFQAEDEIAGVCSAIGASYGGRLAVTTSSGPGIALKGEAMGLAQILELPLVVVNVQRAGPSTGMPTKTEQADLFQALFGRNGECPIPVVAANSPGDCFWTAIEAARIAIRHMTPVVMLTDGYLANSSEPWRIPKMADIEPIDARFHTEVDGFMPYSRDDQLARPWAVPGTPGLEHRVGGLEKQDLTGNVSYDPENHEHMCGLRAQKVQRVADHIPPTEVFGDEKGEVLVLGWGNPFGAIRAAIPELRRRGHRVGHVHLRHIMPFPKDLEGIMRRFRKVLVPELNLGQLVKVLRMEYPGIEFKSYNKVQGKPFKEREIADAVLAQLEVS